MDRGKFIGFLAGVLLVGIFNGPALGASKKSADGKGGELKVGRGVDLKTKTIKIGTLNDESGRAALIGKPYALGKRILAKAVNAGEVKILPDGWKVELVERDHGYNPQKSVQSLKQMQDDILFIATSFGTPTTLPLVPHLESAEIIAFPASLSSLMAGNKQTPPVGPSYTIEARRAMDWVVKSAKDKTSLKVGIIYQNDDYGKDGLKGWREAAKKHNLKIVSEQPTKPGQKDMTAVISTLKSAGATHILLSVLPSATGPILGTAAKMKYMPIWIGSTPAWIDAFFSPKLIPVKARAMFMNYYQCSGTPYIGEDLPGMKKFMAALKKYGGKARQDSYTLLSYIQGLAALEVAKRAIVNGDITRAGYAKSLAALDNWDANGFIQPLSFKKFPYSAGTRVRVLKPDFEKSSWEVVAGYAESE